MEVARLLRRNFRAADYVVRYAGDEFIAIMPDTDMAQGQVALDRLKRFEEIRNRQTEGGAKLRLSCGLAIYRPGMTIEDLVDAADRDMYRQKPHLPASQTTPRSPL